MPLSLSLENVRKEYFARFAICAASSEARTIAFDQLKLCIGLHRGEHGLRMQCKYIGRRKDGFQWDP